MHFECTAMNTTLGRALAIMQRNSPVDSEHVCVCVNVCVCLEVEVEKRGTNVCKTLLTFPMFHTKIYFTRRND